MTWDPERAKYPGKNFDEELRARAWENLSEAEKGAAVAKKFAERLCYGQCQGCGHKIEALGKDWPARCPSCGFGGRYGG
jgi:rubrerythrin